MNVSYDHRAILINGERLLLLSGSIHYPRRFVLYSSNKFQIFLYDPVPLECGKTFFNYPEMLV